MGTYSCLCIYLIRISFNYILWAHYMRPYGVVVGSLVTVQADVLSLPHYQECVSLSMNVTFFNGLHVAHVPMSHWARTSALDEWLWLIKYRKGLDLGIV